VTKHRSLEPTLDVELEILSRGYRVLGAIDEVGRGAIAGPASAGVVVIDQSVGAVPAGVRDSKKLSPAQRRKLVPMIQSWAVDSAVAHASAAEVDELGIVRALALAARRAMALLDITPDVILLDGSHDWLSSAGDQFSVITKVRADLTCAAVSAASVLAKVQRDDLMVQRASTYPKYAWESNKGYASAAHLDAIRENGTCDEHRRSWNLPGVQRALWSE
jgi:ribonuclease HII